MHNYEVGDKVIIVEDAPGVRINNSDKSKSVIPKYKSAIGKVGTISEIHTGACDISGLPYECDGGCTWRYNFNQFKPYVKEQAPYYPKLKVGEVYENKLWNSIFIFNGTDDFTFIHGKDAGSGYDWQLYEYGVGDEIELLTNYQERLPSGYCITLKGKYTIEENNRGNISLKQGDKYYLINNLCDFTLIKSARWTQENKRNIFGALEGQIEFKDDETQTDIYENPLEKSLDEKRQDLKDFYKEAAHGCDLVTDLILERRVTNNVRELGERIKTNEETIKRVKKPKIKWEYKFSQPWDEIWGYINDKREYEISILIDKSNCLLRFSLFTKNISHLGYFNSLEKAKKYALKHYKETKTT